MRGLLYKSAFVVVLFLVCGRAGGQAPPESALGAKERWHETVEEFAAALVATDHEAVNRLLADRLVIRELDRRDPGTVGRLMNRTEVGEVVGVLSYTRAPGQVASEIVGLLQDAERVPPHVRAWMAPSGESGMNRANAVAARWVAESVGATERCPVGVLLLWCPVQTWPSVSGDRAKSHQLVFVLVKGAPVEQPERISGVAFGNPHPAAGQ